MKGTFRVVKDHILSVGGKREGGVGVGVEVEHLLLFNRCHSTGRGTPMMDRSSTHSTSRSVLLSFVVAYSCSSRHLNERKRLSLFHHQPQ